MDNLTHSLFGLTLARTPLGRAGRGTTAALLLASNAPDIDIVVTAGGSANYLAYHRGPTHGPLVAMYRPARKPWLDALVRASRARPNLSTAPTSLAGIRTLVRTLKSGGYTAILPDQVPPQGQGVWAPFFGREVYTMTLLPKLAQQTGAVVLLSWCERLPGSRYCFHFEDVDLRVLSDAMVSAQETVIHMNRVVEDVIRQHPDQYLWGYARDKQPREAD